MGKVKLFLENFFVYGLGGIISKLVPLIMVPIITRLLPDTSYYGISDLANTLVSFGSAIAVMGMYDAMYRMFFEQDDTQFKVRVCSTAFSFTIISSFTVALIMILFRSPISKYFFGERTYQYLVYICAMETLVGATNNIISAPTRMQNKRKVFLVTNTVSPLLSYGISIPLILKGYYVIALPLAALVSAICMEISFYFLNHEWFTWNNRDLKLLKQMLVIAIPLLPNFLIYWVFNSCDKLMITNMLSVGASGIYSVGSKLGHVSQLIYTAFAGGWQYFAFSTMKEEGQVESNSSVFEYLGVISFAASMFMCAFSLPVFKLLFTGEYVQGYVVAPYLFLAPLLQMLFQVACNQFLVIKKTWPNMLILSSGAVLNVIVNSLLIPILGIEGAAIATLIGYVVSDIICVIVLCKMKLMLVKPRFVLSVMIVFAYFITWRIFYRDFSAIGLLVAVVALLVYLLLYRRELTTIYKAIQNKLGQRRKSL